MKFYVLACLNLLLFSNTSFAMDQLDNEFQRGNYGRMLLATHPEDFRVQNPQYTGTSPVCGNYPKAMLTKPYNGEDGIFYNA